MTAAASNGVPRKISSHEYLIQVLIGNVLTYLSFFRCLEHVVNLANVAVMGHITKIAVTKNTNAILEYDPELLDNRVLGGSLDVVVALQTLVVKVCTSVIKPVDNTYPSLTDSSLRTAH